MTFKPGQSGNPNGRAKQKIWRDAISAAIRHRTGKDQVEAVKEVALALVDAAMAKDVTALKEIGDRLDGKSEASVSVEHSGGVTHQHEGVSFTAEWLGNTLGKRQAESSTKPVLN